VENGGEVGIKFMKKNYSEEEAQKIIGSLRQRSMQELDGLFDNGNAPEHTDFSGDTRGSFLAWNPGNPRWLGWGIRLLFQSPFARWTGKRFLPISGEAKGSGYNLFANRILPHRFSFDTYTKNALRDARPCLALDYRSYRSLMFGLIDDVREIQEGVLLGQMYFQFPWRKTPMFVGYFTLCALQSHT
jgi:hypothetical protein